MYTHVYILKCVCIYLYVLGYQWWVMVLPFLFCFYDYLEWYTHYFLISKNLKDFQVQPQFQIRRNRPPAWELAQGHTWCWAQERPNPGLLSCWSLETETSLVALVVKNLPANAGAVRDTGSISGSGRPPGGGHGSPLQYSCLENPMDRGAWRATVHRVAKSQTWLKQLSTETV